MRWISKLRVATRMRISIAVALVGMLTLGATALPHLRATMLEDQMVEETASRVRGTTAAAADLEQIASLLKSQVSLFAI